MKTRLRTVRRWLGVLSALLALSGLALLAPEGIAMAKRKAAPAKPAAKAEPAAKGQSEPAGDADAQTKVKVERGAGGKKVYKIEGEIVIEGKIQKPEAFYVLQKSSINYDWHELKQEFVPKILDSVTKPPF
jgi:hypothetical protein